MTRAFALIALLAASACARPVDGVSGPCTGPLGARVTRGDLNEQACAEIDGRWSEKDCRTVCICPATDIGLACAGGPDCEGACVADVSTAEECGGQTVGRCDAYRAASGCMCFLTAGKAHWVCAEPERLAGELCAPG